MKTSHVILATELGIDVMKNTQKAYEDLVDLLSEDYNRVNALNEELEKLLGKAREAMEPFRFAAASSDGRIPTEKLAFADWHYLSKSCKAIDVGLSENRSEYDYCLACCKSHAPVHSKLHHREGCSYIAAITDLQSAIKQMEGEKK